MINITELWIKKNIDADNLRYKKGCHRKPVVVWNITRRCNLKCIYCYSNSTDKKDSGELTTREAKEFIGDLAEFKVPVIIFSGGEPLLRPDLFALIKTAKSEGIRVVISTNGTLITEEMSREMRDIGVDYIGISVDGIGKINDRLRGAKGAFKKTLAGIHNCRNAGLKVGLRFTITRLNFKEIPSVFNLIEKEEITRACFYHLVYSGRGRTMQHEDISHITKREVLDYIIGKVSEFHRKGMEKDILTVGNHADGVYLYLKLLKENGAIAKRTLKLLKINGGNSSGEGIANVDNLGTVHPDQFWQNYSLGNIRENTFSRIWQSGTSDLLKDLHNRKQLLKGRCRDCSFLDICNGNFRVRAEQVYGDVWQEDPACYLTKEEICTTIHRG